MHRPILVLALLAAAAHAQQTPPAVFTDPPHNAAHPARMEVLHVPSGDVSINGVAYVAAGAGAHPTFVFFHGLPGNEKNLDLAQAVRRAGWTAVTVNYRGSWGSPGPYRFANNLQDADAVLAYLQDSANATKLGVDRRRIVIAGHSMGGWVAAHAGSHHPELRGVILISAADMGAMGRMPRDQVLALMADNLESLAGTTPEGMADEVITNASSWEFSAAAPGLAKMPLLALTSNDGLAPHTDALVKRLRALGNTKVVTDHRATDHSWSDRRIALESAVIRWLERLR